MYETGNTVNGPRAAATCRVFHFLAKPCRMITIQIASPVSSLFCYSYELASLQTLCFDNHLNCPEVGVAAGVPGNIYGSGADPTETIQLTCFQSLAHSFALFAKSELLIALFSIACALFTKNTRVYPLSASASAADSQSRNPASRSQCPRARLRHSDTGPKPSQHTCTTPAAAMSRKATADATTRPTTPPPNRPHAPRGMPRRAHVRSAH